MDENVNDGKESNNELRKHQKMKKPQTDPRAAEISTSNASQVILEDCQAFSHFGDNGEPTSVFTKTAEKDSFMAKTSLEKSYSISPYQFSDDEEDEEDERDEIRTKKFVPSWASKNSVALVLSSQQKVDPYIIFPPESFCSIDEDDDGGKQLRASYSCVDEVKISSNSSSSGKQRSLNPELTCFPIEEDPSISGENENIDEVADTIQEDISSTLMTRAKRQPLAEIKEACVNPPTSVSAAERFPDRNSLDSINTEVSATGAQSRIKQKLGNRYSNKRRCTNEAKENRSLSVSTNCIKKATESLNNRFSKPKLSGKTSLRKAGQNLLERESKRNNIVSNITSFLPLVQQKQAAAVGTGKRDIKVKALEAAKRLEEKRQNERKMKKDALKLERERKEQENLRQMEINKKKKEEEQKKKDADMEARKRLREEEERKEKERKRKRIEEPRQQQRGKEEKLRAGKEKEVPFGAMPTSVFTKTAEKDSFMAKTSLEKSYSISPYQCSDDEEDEEDERAEICTKKFVPSWASKNSVALVLSSQQKVDPYIIFPPESFCSIDEGEIQWGRRSLLGPFVVKDEKFVEMFILNAMLDEDFFLVLDPNLMVSLQFGLKLAQPLKWPK
ncbi:hypothetical protein LOK49_LG06G00320 [Camellia lanceoleosa]|uniref:Uncharacterized protein n=1 Tax=Camellia lanceoleosa TaxID=1840588 RepID=A0ACC0HCW7_9ERIC|nr:hypothetical protein LOK49_LG06G00320 [Camellia lanceoleosa]